MAALAAPATGTPRTGSASGHLGGTPTHCFCVGFEDYSACFFSQTGGVGRVVVADGAATTTKENENLARLAFQNDQKKGLDYKTVVTMASKDDLERATVEMWNQIVYDAEIASRELNDLALSSLKSSTNSASSIEANAQGGDVTHSTLADKARGNVETIKNAIGSLIYRRKLSLCWRFRKHSSCIQF